MSSLSAEDSAASSAAQALKKTPVQRYIVDRRNFHLFQPLLYQVATGWLSPANVASNLRATSSTAEKCPGAFSGNCRSPRQRARFMLSDGRSNTILDPSDRLATSLFRQRELGKNRAGTKDRRRRHRNPPAAFRRLRKQRNAKRIRETPEPFDFHHCRRRTHRRRISRALRRDCSTIF